jgi:type I restriction-modification system DNA methylase subunit
MKPTLVTILRDLAHGVGIWQIWCDFCEIAAITISNRVDLIHYDEREARYLAIVKRYTRPQLDAFARALGTLACQLEDGIDDVLGRAFMDLELGNKWAGQFFTPFHLCRLTVELQIDDSLRAKVTECGYVTMADPAVGAGAFPLAMAAALRDAGINYQQALHVTGQDIDAKAIHMAYVQLSLCHVPAVLIVGDTLRAPGQGERWYTPAHVMGNWSGRLARKEAA